MITNLLSKPTVFFSQSERKLKPTVTCLTCVFPRLIFPRLTWVARFPALGTGYTFSRAWQGSFFSRAWHGLHFFPRLTRVTLFPAFGTGCTFGTACTFSRAWHGLQMISCSFKGLYTGNSYLPLSGMQYSDVYGPGSQKGLIDCLYSYSWRRKLNKKTNEKPISRLDQKSDHSECKK